MSPLLLVLTTLALSTSSRADEGMWTFNRFPSDKVAEKYGFKPSTEWLNQVRLSSVRLAEGCSGSFVSPDGLILTNHHCVHPCVEQLSTQERDRVKTGFYAETAEQEQRCPEMEVNQLIEIRDVTEQVGKATRNLDGQAYVDAQRAVISSLERSCATSDDLRCDVVNLYHGGAYNLYVYQRYQDVRLVFAPEFDIAFFGGDPDNFMFPRYNLDSAFVRVWSPDKKGGKTKKGSEKPLKTANWLPWAEAPIKEGALTFVSGHPGRTARLETTAQLEYQRDVDLPERLFLTSEWRGMLREFMERGPDAKRIATTDLFYLENSFKARHGMWQALVDPALFSSKKKAEDEIRAKVNADPALKAELGGAWDEVERAMALMRDHREQLWYIEWGRGFSSDLFSHARTLVRATDEKLLPNEKRLSEYRDANLPAIRQDLASTAPVYEDLEIAKLTLSLLKLREVLGADDPFVRGVLGAKSPAELATELVKGSRLKDPAARMKLYEGGKATLDASDDPMIRLARLTDPEARKVRKIYEEQISPVLDKNGEKISKAWFRFHGDTYPDATFTLRLSYGAVRGYEESGHKVEPFTRVKGLYDRATGSEPFALPQRWLDARSKLSPDTPFNMVTDNDIIGGNSGSPVIDKEGRLVGLVFDGNIQSLGGDFWFDERVNRAVAVTATAILEALDKVYGADRLATELRKSATTGGKGKK